MGLRRLARWIGSGDFKTHEEFCSRHQLLRYSTHQAAREQRPRRSRNELIQGPLSNLRVLTAHASACSMKVSSRVPQGDQQTVLHSGDAAQSVRELAGSRHSSRDFTKQDFLHTWSCKEQSKHEEALHTGVQGVARGRDRASLTAILPPVPPGAGGPQRTETPCLLGTLCMYVCMYVCGGT